MSHCTQRSSTPCDTFRLAHPSTHRTITLIASTPALAMVACGRWLSAPVEQIAITRRSSVRELFA